MIADKDKQEQSESFQMVTTHTGLREFACVFISGCLDLGPIPKECLSVISVFCLHSHQVVPTFCQVAVDLSKMRSQPIQTAAFSCIFLGTVSLTSTIISLSMESTFCLRFGDTKL